MASNLAAWWQAQITALWSAASGRSDVSIGTPYGTTITSPVNGVVLASGTNNPFGAYGSYGKQPWGGEVDILTNLAGIGPQVLSLIHLDTLNVQPGQTVNAGEVLGTSGGQTSGGNWPSLPKYSTGPHIGLRLYSPNDWHNLTLGPNQTYQNIQSNNGQLVYNGQPSSLPSDVSGTQTLSYNPPAGLGTVPGSVSGLIPNLSGWTQAVAQIVAGVENDVLGFSIRAGLVLLGAVLLVLAVVVFFVADPERRQATEQAAQTAVIATG